MPSARTTICWTPLWNAAREGVGLEHVLLAEGAADSIILAFDEKYGPFRLTYRLAWDASWRIRDAEFAAVTEQFTRSLHLQTDGHSHWRHADGRAVDALDGCIDIDLWPSPFTNTFPIRREALRVGERHEFRIAWVRAPELTVRAQPQAYTRLADRLFLFESLDGSGFKAELPVDQDGIVIDYRISFCGSRINSHVDATLTLCATESLWPRAGCVWSRTRDRGCARRDRFVHRQSGNTISPRVSGSGASPPTRTWLR